MRALRFVCIPARSAAVARRAPARRARSATMTADKDSIEDAPLVQKSTPLRPGPRGTAASPLRPSPCRDEPRRAPTCRTETGEEPIIFTSALRAAGLRFSVGHLEPTGLAAASPTAKRPNNHGSRSAGLDRELHLGPRRRRAAGPVRARQVPRRDPADDRPAPAGRGAGADRAQARRNGAASRPTSGS